MKVSPVLPITLSALLTTSLAAPTLRYPTTAEAEKRADTFLTPKNFDQKIHENLNFGSGEPLLRRDIQKNAKRVDSLAQSDNSEGGDQSASVGQSAGSTSALDGTGSSTSFDEAIHQTLDFGGDTDPLLFKKNAEPVEKRDNLDSTIHDDLDFGGVTDPVLFKKDAIEKRANDLPTGTDDESSFDNSIHEDLDFGGTTDPLLGSSGSSLTLFRRAGAAVDGALEKVARAFHA